MLISQRCCGVGVKESSVPCQLPRLQTDLSLPSRQKRSACMFLQVSSGARTNVQQLRGTAVRRANDSKHRHVSAKTVLTLAGARQVRVQQRQQVFLKGWEIGLCCFLLTANKATSANVWLPNNDCVAYYVDHTCPLAWLTKVTWASHTWCQAGPYSSRRHWSHQHLSHFHLR